MLKIGLTGGIGSGKTTVGMVFKKLGIPVYDADTQAKRLMNSDDELKSALKSAFGSDIYREDGTLARRRLAEIIFSEPAMLEKVNGWVHPAVARDFEHWCSRQAAPYVIEEAAIIFERNIASRFAKVILVTASDEVRIRRVCRRDKAAPEEVRKRMANQWTEDKKIALADFVIYNDQLSLLTHQVMEIHGKLKSGL